MKNVIPESLQKTTIIGPDGELAVNPGRFSRQAIIVAFEMIGGVEAFSEWADENRGDFYTKLFTKVVGKEIEIGVTEDVESLLDMLDNGVLENADIVEADYQMIENTSKKYSERLKHFAEEYAEGELDESEPQDY